MGDLTRGIKPPTTELLGVIGTRKPLHHGKVVAQGGANIILGALFKAASACLSLLLSLLALQPTSTPAPPFMLYLINQCYFLIVIDACSVLYPGGCAAALLVLNLSM